MPASDGDPALSPPHLLPRVCHLSSLTAHPSRDRRGGSRSGWRRKGSDQSGLMNHSSMQLTEMLYDRSAPLKHTHTHSHAYMNIHSTTTPEAYFHTDSWAIDYGLYVHNMRSTKRGVQSHSVESSLAVRPTPSP